MPQATFPSTVLPQNQSTIHKEPLHPGQLGVTPLIPVFGREAEAGRPLCLRPAWSTKDYSRTAGATCHKQTTKQTNRQMHICRENCDYVSKEQNASQGLGSEQGGQAPMVGLSFRLSLPAKILVSHPTKRLRLRTECLPASPRVGA